MKAPRTARSRSARCSAVRTSPRPTPWSATIERREPSAISITGSPRCWRTTSVAPMKPGGTE